MESFPQDSAFWRKEKVVIDAAYGKERLTVYRFLPARVRAPYQTAAFFPSARALTIRSSETLTDMKFIDYIIQSGRAVIYPVYKGTYERSAAEPLPDKVAGRETLIQDSKDLGRRSTISRRARISIRNASPTWESMGASLGVVLTAVEARFSAVVLQDGGFFQEKLLPGTDQADFAPRVKVPTLRYSSQVVSTGSSLARTPCYGCWARRSGTKGPSPSTPPTTCRHSGPTLSARYSRGWTSISARSIESA